MNAMKATYRITHYGVNKGHGHYSFTREFASLIEAVREKQRLTERGVKPHRIHLTTVFSGL